MHTKLHRITHAKAGNFASEASGPLRPKTWMGGNFYFLDMGLS